MLADRATRITIHGRDFALPLREEGTHVRAERWTVSIGEHSLSDVRWISSSSIEATVPPGFPPGPKDVSIRIEARELVLEGALLVVTPLAPRLDRVLPTSVSSAAGGKVLVEGAGFHVGSTVAVRGQAVPTRWISDQSLEVDLPPDREGSAVIEVLTPVGRTLRDDVLAYGPP